MPWFKVDDSLESHPKIKAIPRPRRLKAMGLWVLAGSWSANQLTDGFVPTYMLGELAASKTEANTLVEVGLWSVVDGGYVFKDWHDWQPTKAKVEADREAAKERMRVARERKKGGSSGDVRANTSERQQNGSGEVRSTPRSVTPTRPDPTRPDPKEDADASSGRSLRSLPETDDRFDEFWDTYAKKVKRADAEKKWVKALRKASADRIISAAAAYVTHERANNQGGRFIADPSTWLHGERWRDERTDLPPPKTRVQEHLTLVQQLAAEEAAAVREIPASEIGHRR